MLVFICTNRTESSFDEKISPEITKNIEPTDEINNTFFILFLNIFLIFLPALASLTYFFKPPSLKQITTTDSTTNKPASVTDDVLKQEKPKDESKTTALPDSGIENKDSSSNLNTEKTPLVTANGGLANGGLANGGLEEPKSKSKETKTATLHPDSEIGNKGSFSSVKGTFSFTKLEKEISKEKSTLNSNTKQSPSVLEGVPAQEKSKDNSKETKKITLPSGLNTSNSASSIKKSPSVPGGDSKKEQVKVETKKTKKITLLSGSNTNNPASSTKQSTSVVKSVNSEQKKEETKSIQTKSVPKEQAKSVPKGQKDTKTSSSSDETTEKLLLSSFKEERAYNAREQGILTSTFTGNEFDGLGRKSVYINNPSNTNDFFQSRFANRPGFSSPFLSDPVLFYQNRSTLSPMLPYQSYAQSLFPNDTLQQIQHGLIAPNAHNDKIVLSYPISPDQSKFSISEQTLPYAPILPEQIRQKIQRELIRPNYNNEVVFPYDQSQFGPSDQILNQAQPFIPGSTYSYNPQPIVPEEILPYCEQSVFGPTYLSQDKPALNPILCYQTKPLTQDSTYSYNTQPIFPGQAEPDFGPILIYGAQPVLQDPAQPLYQALRQTNRGPKNDDKE